MAMVSIFFVTKAFSLFSSSVSLIFSRFTFPSAAPLLTVVNVQSHLRARGWGGARPRVGRVLALHADRLSCVKEARVSGRPAGREVAPRHSLFCVGRWFPMFLSGCPGLGGPCSAAQGRAGSGGGGREGKKEKQQATQEQGAGSRAGGRRGGSRGKAQPCLWLSW